VPGNDDAGRAISLYCDLVARAAIDGISRHQGELGIDTGALANLTAEGSSKVPDVVQTHPHIRYRSYVGSGRVGLLRTCAIETLNLLGKIGTCASSGGSACKS